jgi:hypothetical protein
MLQVKQKMAALLQEMPAIESASNAMYLPGAFDPF